MLDDVNTLYKIASLYYENGNTQDEIAHKVDMSRPMVSRALDKARNIGLVRISVVPPKKFTDLSKTISQALGIKEIVIAPSSSSTGNERLDRINDITDTAASYLERAITGGMNVGFGCGFTVYNTVKKLRQSRSVDQDPPVFVPLIGSIGSKRAEYQESVIINQAATMFNAKAFYYNVPVLQMNDRESLEHMNRQHNDVIDLWSRLDMAVIGLGSFANIKNYPMNDFSTEDYNYLISNGVKGDILGRFFNDHGYLAPVNLSSYYSGIKREDLNNVKNIVCICGGSEKVMPIIAAARNKFFDTLITDYRTINELNEILQEENS
ncbi:MAG: hypothetical protein IKP61_03860 [Spirochaetales bacterium]|nr:hypothetical protein [Spirochaetales bacterium]